MHPVELVEPAHLVLEVSTARDDVHANRINVGADSRDDHDRFTSERSILPDVTAVIPKRCRPYDRTWHSILEVHVILPYAVDAQARYGPQVIVSYTGASQPLHVVQLPSGLVPLRIAQLNP